MSETRSCMYAPCSKEFTPTHPRQKFCEPTCRANQHYVDNPDKGRVLQGGALRSVATHPLADARAEQEEVAINRRYGLLIRQAIIDRLKTTGTCHADDLESLYPADELARKRCRKLAGAQFGSLASPRGSKEPLIREKERRKSSIPERKCAKSGVYEFTKAGWLKYGRAGVGGGANRGAPPGLHGVGTAASHSGEAGLTGPGRGADGVETSTEPPGPEEAPVISTASPQSGKTRNCLPGSGIGAPSPKGSGGAVLPCSSSDTALSDQSVGSPEPLSLLPEPDPESWAA